MINGNRIYSVFCTINGLQQRPLSSAIRPCFMAYIAEKEKMEHAINKAIVLKNIGIDYEGSLSTAKFHQQQLLEIKEKIIEMRKNE